MKELWSYGLKKLPVGMIKSAFSPARISDLVLDNCVLTLLTKQLTYITSDLFSLIWLLDDCLEF